MDNHKQQRRLLLIPCVLCMATATAGPVVPLVDSLMVALPLTGELLSNQEMSDIRGSAQWVAMDHASYHDTKISLQIDSGGSIDAKVTAASSGGYAGAIGWTPTADVNGSANAGDTNATAEMGGAASGSAFAGVVTGTRAYSQWYHN